MEDEVINALSENQEVLAFIVSMLADDLQNCKSGTEVISTLIEWVTCGWVYGFIANAYGTEFARNLINEVGIKISRDKLTPEDDEWLHSII